MRMERRGRKQCNERNKTEREAGEEVSEKMNEFQWEKGGEETYLRLRSLLTLFAPIFFTSFSMAECLFHIFFYGRMPFSHLFLWQNALETFSSRQIPWEYFSLQVWPQVAGSLKVLIFVN